METKVTETGIGCPCLVQMTECELHRLMYSTCSLSVHAREIYLGPEALTMGKVLGRHTSANTRKAYLEDLLRLNAAQAARACSP